MIIMEHIGTSKVKKINYISQRFETLCLFHLHRRVGMKMIVVENSRSQSFSIATRL
jgi:hypothetical protein